MAIVKEAVNKCATTHLSHSLDGKSKIIGYHHFHLPVGESNEAIENIIKGLLENQHTGPLCARVNALLCCLFHLQSSLL